MKVPLVVCVEIIEEVRDTCLDSRYLIRDRTKVFLVYNFRP